MRRVVFAINITTDGYCNHTDMIADDAVHEYFTKIRLKVNPVTSHYSLVEFRKVAAELAKQL